VTGVLFRDISGMAIIIGVVDTGVSDSHGNEIYRLATSGGSVLASPANPTSANAYADVAGSLIDAQFSNTVSYTILNKDGANGITWQVLAANSSDFSDSVVAQAGANVAAAGVGTFSTNPALYRYYKVQVKDQVGGSHAIVQVRGIAR
jgi:hypothetical protein